MIRIENINKFYKLGKGRFHALKDVSLEIGDGEFVSVEGRSGAGKDHPAAHPRVSGQL